MLPSPLPIRSGIFISHAHEDGEVAQADLRQNSSPLIFELTPATIDACWSFSS